MTSETSLTGGPLPQKAAPPTVVLLTPRDAAKLLKLSVSWLAKARMHGGGLPDIEIAAPSATGNPCFADG